MFPTSATSQESIGANMSHAYQRTSWSGDRPASPSVSQEQGQDLKEPAGSCGSMFGRYVRSVHDGLSGRTCRERSQAHTGRISDACSKPWMNSGMVWHGGYWTRNTSEWPNGAVASSLSAVLEAHAPEKYSLSPKACAGIIRRADKRGKPLPEQLRRALERQIGRQD